MFRNTYGVYIMAGFSLKLGKLGEWSGKMNEQIMVVSRILP